MFKHLLVWGSFALLPFAAMGDNTSSGPASSTALAAYTVPTTAPAPFQEAVVCKGLSLPRGFEPLNGGTAFDLRTEVIRLTDRGVSKGGFNGFLADVFWQQDPPDKINTIYQQKLDSVIDQIQSQWAAKYRQALVVSDSNLVFNEQFAIVPGQVSDTWDAVSNWPVAAIPGTSGTPADRSDAVLYTDEEKVFKLISGRNVALIRFPATQRTPAITVSMIAVLPTRWRPDLPGKRTRDQIYSDLLAHLTFIRDHEHQWPDNVSDSYRLVACHIMAALYGVPTSDR